MRGLPKLNGQKGLTASGCQWMLSSQGLLPQIGVRDVACRFEDLLPLSRARNLPRVLGQWRVDTNRLSCWIARPGALLAKGPKQIVKRRTIW